MQEKIAAFIHEFSLETDTSNRILDLLSETGELAKSHLKSTDYGKNTFTPTNNWREELGDIAFCLYALAIDSGVNLEQELENVLEKYRTRFQKKGHIGSGF